MASKRSVTNIDLNALERDRDQLFAEAVHLFRKGDSWWPDKAFEAEHIKPEQDARYENDAWEQSIADYVAERAKVAKLARPPKQVAMTILDIAREGLSIEAARLGTADQRRITAILMRAGSGWTRKRTSTGWLWFPPSWMLTAGTRRPRAG